MQAHDQNSSSPSQWFVSWSLLSCVAIYAFLLLCSLYLSAWSHLSQSGVDAGYIYTIGSTTMPRFAPKRLLTLQAALGAIITWVFIADNTGLDLEEQASLSNNYFFLQSSCKWVSANSGSSLALECLHKSRFNWNMNIICHAILELVKGVHQSLPHWKSSVSGYPSSLALPASGRLMTFGNPLRDWQGPATSRRPNVYTGQAL